MALNSPQPVKHTTQDLVNRTHYDEIQRLTQSAVYLTLQRTATATDYTALISDAYIGVTSTAAARTITLPTAADAGVGKVYYIKDESGAAATNNITIDGAGAETIDGAATVAITLNYGGMAIICNGTAWFRLNREAAVLG